MLAARHNETHKPMTEDNKEKGRGGAAADVAVFGCLATGVLACIGGLVGMSTQQIAGAGLCLIAAALAFGVVAYVSLSD
jgi:hypothetical protein